MKMWMQRWFIDERNGKLRLRAVFTSAATTGLLWIMEWWLNHFSNATIHVVNAFVTSAAALGFWITIVVLLKWLFDWFLTKQV